MKKIYEITYVHDTNICQDEKHAHEIWLYAPYGN